MIQLTETIRIGDSSDSPLKVDAVLNVAQDMRGDCGWPDVEYMQVGLIDGPGNTLSAYCSAVLALATLCKRHDRVLVCCHTGSRSLAVALMYLSVASDHSWDALLDLLRERVDKELPIPHKEHREAFGLMNWQPLAGMIRM